MGKIRLNAIYTTYQGEVNKFGIGAPVIFLRLQGCPIRCYKETMGILCDSPEALERDDNTLRDIQAVVGQLEAIRHSTGVNLICLTGGDPLWQHKDTLHELFGLLREEKFHVSVETSGVISIKPYLQYENVSWVVDYKLFSAGVKMKYHVDNYQLPDGSIVKFVVNDRADLTQAAALMQAHFKESPAQFAFGLFWGTTRMTYQSMVKYLMDTGVFSNRILINFQSHKMAEFYDKNAELVPETVIRTLL